MSDIKLRVLTPHRWMHYGKWRSPEVPANASFNYVVGKVAWPWVGPAQFYLHWYPNLAKVLKEFKPDVIDLWEEHWSLVSAHTIWLRNCMLPNAKIIAETEQNINKKLPPPFEQFRSYTLKHADLVVARNSEAVDVVQSKGYTGPMEVVPNAVDDELFRPMDKEACRSALGLSGFVAGYVGRIVEEKGLMDMVEALALCPSGVRLLFVGSGPFEEPLKKRIEQLGKTDQVQFLPGQPLEKLPEIMNALDALVLVSRTTSTWKEQFGRVIIEAHACETPVIGSSSGAIPDVVGEGGLIVPEGDAAAIAAAMLQLQSNPEQCRRMGVAGLKQVKANYTWQQVAKRMHQIYARVLQPTSIAT
jgi:glycosyltransferase involved in cell wall biosynthesis